MLQPQFPPADQFGRPLRSLRISVTDRCNMRCRYCMPEDEYVWLPRESILTFEELDRLAGVFARLGVGKIRLTPPRSAPGGGEFSRPWGGKRPDSRAGSRSCGTTCRCWSPCWRGTRS